MHCAYLTHHTFTVKEGLKDLSPQTAVGDQSCNGEQFISITCPCTLYCSNSTSPDYRRARGGKPARRGEGTRGEQRVTGPEVCTGHAGSGQRCFGTKRRKQPASLEGGKGTGGRNGSCPINPLHPPFPGEGQTAGGRSPGGQRHISSQATGERDPPQAHPQPRAGEQPGPPAPGAPSLPGRAGGGRPDPTRPALLCRGPAGLTDSAAAACRRRPSSSAARSTDGTRGSGMAGLG